MKLLVYFVHLENVLVKQASNNFHSAVAKTVDEARQLIETGFEYVAKTREGWLLFKKQR